MADHFVETLSFDDASMHGQGHQSFSFSSANESLKKDLLLHGYLDIWVKEAKNLPNKDLLRKKILGKLSKVSFSRPFKRMAEKYTSDPYVTISISKVVIGRTFVIDNEENPSWMQHFSSVAVAHYGAEVVFVVKDYDLVGSDFIGAVGIPVEQLCSGTKVEGTFEILDRSRKPCKPGAVLSLSIQYTPADQAPIFNGGMYALPDYQGVSGTYFPLRKGGKVTLYQDAHVEEDHFRLHGGVEYKHRSCWDDISESINQAQHLIYITGWSVYDKVRLVREGNKATKRNLGKLLIDKSMEEVRVLLLIWDDPTSNSILGRQKVGQLETHDEETRRFFKHSSVKVVLSPRSGGKGHSWTKTLEAGTIYSHHQKTVIVDEDAGNGKRKIVAFVGGLDLCLGRYDTPKHSLFRTLQTTHEEEDFYNGCIKGKLSNSCPRQPWHDLHSKIDGPAAYDVLKNFEERWLRDLKPHGLQRLKRLRELSDDTLLKLETLPQILQITEVSQMCSNDPEAWSVQVFRSIDSNSVEGFPNDPKDAISKNLVCGKNVMIDMSIQSAYVRAIRAAQRFIYIENQYFLGSSYNWGALKDIGANNLIPMEIALKIVNKIKARERFSAYILIPMWPEGAPTSIFMQRILLWQRMTMEMMYEMIYKALEEVEPHKGLEEVEPHEKCKPEDYLNFFCLGNREVSDVDDGVEAERLGGKITRQEYACRRSGRFMIYVHSKGMIVDDEYVILGSANINQRSLEGTGDTEIAMGAYQPRHTSSSTNDSTPRGQVYGYRMSLWREHTGIMEECFERPESIECVREMRALGERNWRQYVAEEVTEMRSHLLKYPLQVGPTGRLTHLPGFETFPDLGGNILGSEGDTTLAVPLTTTLREKLTI